MYSTCILILLDIILQAAKMIACGACQFNHESVAAVCLNVLEKHWILWQQLNDTRDYALRFNNQHEQISQYNTINREASTLRISRYAWPSVYSMVETFSKCFKCGHLGTCRILSQFSLMIAHHRNYNSYLAVKVPNFPNCSRTLVSSGHPCFPHLPISSECNFS